MKFSVSIGILLIAVFNQNGVLCQSTKKPRDIAELRSTLRMLREQNRDLQLQNNRLQFVWVGLKQMCNALNMFQCDCSANGTKGGSAIQISELSTLSTMNKTPKPAPPPLRVTSLKSDGEANDSVLVTVHYSSPDDHTVEWIKMYKNGGILRTSNLQGKVSHGIHNFSSSLKLDHFSEIRLAIVRMYSGDQSLSLRLNLTSIKTAGDQQFPKPENDVIEMNHTYVATDQEDIRIEIVVRGDPRHNTAIGGADVYFTGLNTSANPAAVFEILQFNNEGLSLGLRPRTNDTSTMVITLKKSYAQYGGIVTFRMPQSVGGFISEFTYGSNIKVVSPEGHVMPPGNIGLYPLDRQTTIYTPSQSLTCVAMGNPQPEVNILKMMPDKTFKDVAAEKIQIDYFSTMRVLPLVSDTSAPNGAGTYKCRATSGNKTVETMTDAVTPERAVFDDLKTGVAENTTTAVVLSCKASGRPKPKLEMRLYYPYGPDLSLAGLYKTTMVDLDTSTSEMTLTVTPKDRDIHMVYCVAIQEELRLELSRKIDVYPGANLTGSRDTYRRIQRLVYS